jgi:hypothetical protein
MSLLPDAEALLIAALKAQPSVTALCGGRVGTRLSGTYPAIRVTTLGGGESVADTGSPDLQVECWGDGTGSAAETQASDLARTVHSVGGSLRGVFGPGTVVGSWTYGLPLHSPDPTTARERYIVTVGITLQPTP